MSSTSLSRSTSFFAIGLTTGILVASFGFAMLLRNSQSNALASKGAARVRTLKLAHGLDQNHPVHKAMERMAELVSEKSGRLLRLQVFPNGQLGSETECMEQLQRGALAMTKTSSAPMESFIPEIAVFGVPYAFVDDAHFWIFAESEIGKGLLSAGEGVGLRGLCYYDAGARSFYTTNRPIMQPKDLAGLKIRVQQSKTAMDMVEALGGSPTPIAWGELYTALQQSMVDGAENNPPSFYTNRHFEVCKHLSMDEHTRVPDILLISEKTWQDLSAEEKQWVQEAADESAAFQRELWTQETERVLKAVEQEGVTVHYPNKQAFAEQVASMHQRYAGTKIGELLEIIAGMKP